MNGSRKPPPEWKAESERWMRRALSLARRGEGRTRPNPPVGAVLVRNGRMIGEGYHRFAGGPHAEREALRGLARADTEGATLYVTLEPCCTHGRTPPCTDAILDAGVSEIVVGARDPNPRHAGRGLRLLARRGITVHTGVCRQEAEALIAPFAHWIRTGRPYVTLKMAMTLDGRIADGRGASRWITGPAARREVMALRRRADAVLIGTETARMDNPTLLVKTLRNKSLRLILDPRGQLPLDLNVFTDSARSRTMVAVTDKCPPGRRGDVERTGARVWRCGRGKRVNLDALMEMAGREGCLHVLCEGGGVLAEALVRKGLVNAFWFFMSPHLLGGGGRPVLAGPGWRLEHAPSLRIHEVRRVGVDWLVRATPEGER